MGRPTYSLDEVTPEDRDFIDDSLDGGEDEDDEEWRRELRTLTGYDPSKFDGAEEALESSHAKVLTEETLSGLLGRREDALEYANSRGLDDEDEYEEEEDDEESLGKR